jgi:hypothetical protein
VADAVDIAVDTGAQEACREDLAKLILAWEDRGVSAAESAILLAGTGHAMLAEYGFPLGTLLTAVVSMWRQRGGTL